MQNLSVQGWKKQQQSAKKLSTSWKLSNFQSKAILVIWFFLCTDMPIMAQKYRRQKKIMVINAHNLADKLECKGHIHSFYGHTILTKVQFLTFLKACLRFVRRRQQLRYAKWIPGYWNIIVGYRLTANPSSLPGHEVIESSINYP